MTRFLPEGSLDLYSNQSCIHWHLKKELNHPVILIMILLFLQNIKTGVLRISIIHMAGSIHLQALCPGRRISPLSTCSGKLASKDSITYGEKWDSPFTLTILPHCRLEQPKQALLKLLQLIQLSQMEDIK